MEYKFSGGKKQNNFYVFPAFVSIFIIGALIDRVIHIPIIYSSIGYFFIIGLLGLYVYYRRGVFTLTEEGLVIINSFKHKTIISFREIQFIEIDRKNVSVEIQQIEHKPLYFQIYSQTYFDLLIPELERHRLTIQEK